MQTHYCRQAAAEACKFELEWTGHVCGKQMFACAKKVTEGFFAGLTSFWCHVFGCTCSVYRYINIMATVLRAYLRLFCLGWTVCWPPVGPKDYKGN